MSPALTFEGRPVTTPALSLDHVSVAFGADQVLRDISGDVAAGGSVALIGPNGAGKSTLLKAILGLVPTSEGTITVLGRAPADARRDVAYVAQADTLDREFPVSVLDVAMMGRYPTLGWFRRLGRDDRRIARQSLERRPRRSCRRPLRRAVGRPTPTC